MSNDRAAIEKAVHTYFDAFYENDVDKIASVFHPTCELTFEKDGELVIWPRDEWLDRIRDRVSAKAQGLERDDAILMFDQPGPSIAMVKVKCQFLPSKFTDYLVFAKAGGAWKVAQKVFMIEQ